MSERRDDVLYPNRDPERSSGDSSGIDRRTLLAGSAAAGSAATAGCLGGGDDGPQETVYVFNTGDDTVSVIDPVDDAVVATRFLGATASFPANQFAADYVTEPGRPLWLNVDDGVRGVDPASLSEVASLTTGSGANWQELTPDGERLVVSAREPTHAQYLIDAAPNSDGFGDVVAEIDRSDEGGRGGNDGPGPCDVTIHPEGEYAYVPDIFGDTLSVVRIDPFEVVTQVEVDPVGDAGAAAPWMGTAARDGETLLVENNEGETGTESIWDVSDPASPEEVARLTADDGLGELPLTSEIGPDSEIGYVFTPDSDDVSVVDIPNREVIDRLDLGGSAFVGTWGPSRETLYVPVRSNDEVAVIDHADRAVTTTLSVGASPYGATAGSVRPEGDAANGLLATIAGLGIDLSEGGTTYCVGECACGHEL